MKEWQGGYKYFSESEMICKCGCGLLPKHEFMLTLDVIRERSGFPLVVLSGARCPAHNSKVASTGVEGPHTLGLAADVQATRLQAYRLVQMAIEAGITGIGINQDKKSTGSVHLDKILGIPGYYRPLIWSF